MPATTNRFALPYPISTDTPAGHTQMQTLAEAVDTALGKIPAGLQEGAVDTGSFEVTQASGGASMVLDVASNVGTGAFVQDDGVAPVALYYVPPTGAKSTVTAAAAHATLPRVDAIVVSLVGAVSIVTGTATSGATLDNARDGSHGGAAIPSDALHLADVLVPATDTTLSNSQIRDRRKWARGAYRRIVRSAGDYTTTSTSAVEVDTTNLNPRIECSGVPLRVSLRGTLLHSADTEPLSFELWIDGANTENTRQIHTVPGNSDSDGGVIAEWDFSPAAGSHRFAPAWFVGGIGQTGTLRASSGFYLQMVIEEIVRQDTANNATTTG